MLWTWPWLCPSAFSCVLLSVWYIPTVVWCLECCGRCTRRTAWCCERCASWSDPDTTIRTSPHLHSRHHSTWRMLPCRPDGQLSASAHDLQHQQPHCICWNLWQCFMNIYSVATTSSYNVYKYNVNLLGTFKYVLICIPKLVSTYCHDIQA
jgi:hypothetical protein